MSGAFDDWWRDHYSMANRARGAAETAWNAATARAAEIADNQWWLQYDHMHLTKADCGRGIAHRIRNGATDADD